MGQALYRTYRPRALKEVIGQEHVTDTLLRAIKAGRVSHAYLFTGPRGVGKTSIARILAYEINKLPYGDTPHLDIIEIDAASNRRIDDIRDLRDKVHIAPVSAAYKVYIIDEVHMLTGESFNALLKTLEEPPAHVVFMLATTEAHKLPATIISRTQRFALRPVVHDKVTAHLQAIAKKEGITITDEAVALIAENGEGSFRDSISLLDQLAHTAKGEITAADVTRSLGLASHTAIDALVAAVISGDQKAVAATLQELEAAGTAPNSLTTQLAKALTAQALAQPELYALIDALLDVPRAYNPGLKLLTVLMLHTHTAKPAAPDKPAHTSTPAKRAAATAQAATPAVTIQSKPPQKAQRTPEPSEPPERHTAQPLAALTPEDWGKVLGTIKQKNAPLYSVIKQAQPDFDTATQKLTLKFKYQLHSKKLDDTKQKALLVSIIEAVIGGAPSIYTAVDKQATPAAITDDPTVANVAAIMGGGEVLNAETI